MSGRSCTGMIWPGSLAANATFPGRPTAPYSVMNSPPPPTARLRPPKTPAEPAPRVDVRSWIDSLIQDSSPASAIRLSLGLSDTSRTGMTVPVILDSMVVEYGIGLCRRVLARHHPPRTRRAIRNCKAPKVVGKRPDHGAHRHRPEIQVVV